MKFRLQCAVVCLLAANAFSAAGELSEAEIEGRAVALRLIQTQPVENSSMRGVLKIFPRKKQRTEVPMEFQTIVTGTNWQMIYSTETAAQERSTAVTIIHDNGQPNRYQLSQKSSGEAKTLTGNETMIPFAGSDFFLADLGLEFLHWPEQTILKKELRKGQSCYVLESTNPNPSADAYTRVVSWIDIDSVREAGQAAIMHADAYDIKGKRWKEFDPVGVKKVNGEWRLREMEMYNAKTRSRSVIEFIFDSE